MNLGCSPNSVHRDQSRDEGDLTGPAPGALRERIRGAAEEPALLTVPQVTLLPPFRTLGTSVENHG